MDICVIIIIAASGLRGLSAGFILSLFNMASYLVAGIIAKIYYPFLAKFVLEDTNWALKLQQFVYNNMKFISKNGVQAQGESYENIFEMMNLPKMMGSLFLKSDFVKTYSEGVLHNINVYISQMIARTIVDILSIIIIFFAVKIILSILVTILNGIASLPIIKQFNRLGGLAFGVLKGACIVYIFTAIMVPVASIFPSSYLVNTLDSSSIAKSFYDYNILLYMLKNIVNYGGSQIVNSF